MRQHLGAPGYAPDFQRSIRGDCYWLVKSVAPESINLAMMSVVLTNNDPDVSTINLSLSVREGFPSSSLNIHIHSLSKALVGEHRALSGMTMILTPLCSPDILFFFNMHSYMNLVVLALAASIISSALSAPIQYRYGPLLVEFRGRA
jgi:hypothetical protein